MGVLENPATALGTVEQDGLAQRALDVLEANWRGASTVPSPALYPHQWSWDSACIAIGYSHLNPPRAEQSAGGRRSAHGLGNRTDVEGDGPQRQAPVRHPHEP